MNGTTFYSIYKIINPQCYSVLFIHDRDSYIMIRHHEFIFHIFIPNFHNLYRLVRHSQTSLNTVFGMLDPNDYLFATDKLRIGHFVPFVGVCGIEYSSVLRFFFQIQFLNQGLVAKKNNGFQRNLCDGAIC